MNQPARTQRIAIPLTVVVALVASAIAYLGTRGAPAPPAAQSATIIGATVNGTVRSIVLPQLEVELPDGPHRREFIVACTTCHSARIVLNQPPLARAKWGEVLQKMVKTYGAPIAAADEPALLDYLESTQGK
jgi:hypothetical protein